MKTMKNRICLFCPVVATAVSLVLTGCEGIPGVPYRADTPATRIYESRVSSDASAKTTGPLTVPVVAGDADAALYLDFSDVRVDVQEKDGQKTVRVYADLVPKEVVWRVSFIKDGQEIYHFNTSSRMDYNSEIGRASCRER